MNSSSGPCVPNEVISSYGAALRYLDGEHQRDFIPKKGAKARAYGGGLVWHPGRITTELPMPGWIGVRYHDTEVIRLHEDGATSFHSGGFRTISTGNWMDSHERFSVRIAVGRRGKTPKTPSTVRYAGRDAAIEQRLREQYGFASEGYISRWGGPEWHPELGTSIPVPAIELERRRCYFEDLDAKLRRAAPTYIFNDGITFTQRGRCMTPGAMTLAEINRENRRENLMRTRLRRAASSCAYKAIRRLRRGMTLPNCGECHGSELGQLLVAHEHRLAHMQNRSVSSELILTAVESWLHDRRKDPKDWKFWLNMHFNNRNHLALGGSGLAPRVEPHIWRAVYTYLTASIPELTY